MNSTIRLRHVDMDGDEKGTERERKKERENSSARVDTCVLLTDSTRRLLEKKSSSSSITVEPHLHNTLYLSEDSIA